MHGDTTDYLNIFFLFFTRIPAAAAHVLTMELVKWDIQQTNSVVNVYQDSLGSSAKVKVKP